jgi:hypothetical protein
MPTLTRESVDPGILRVRQQCKHVVDGVENLIEELRWASDARKQLWQDEVSRYVYGTVASRGHNGSPLCADFANGACPTRELDFAEVRAAHKPFSVSTF